MAEELVPVKEQVYDILTGKANEAWEKGTAEGAGEVFASGVGAVAGTLAAPFLGPLGGSLVAKGVEKSVKGRLTGLTQGAIDVGQSVQEEGVVPVLEKGFNLAQKKYYGYEDFGPPKPEEFTETTTVKGERILGAEAGTKSEEKGKEKEREVLDTDAGDRVYETETLGIYEGKDYTGRGTKKYYERIGPTKYRLIPDDAKTWYDFRRDPYERGIWIRTKRRRFDGGMVDSTKTPGVYENVDGKFVLQIPKKKEAPKLNPVSEVMFPPEPRSVAQEIGEAVAAVQMARQPIRKNKGLGVMSTEDDIAADMRYRAKYGKAKRSKVMSQNNKGLTFVKKTGRTDNLDAALGPKKMVSKPKKVLTPSEKKYRKKYKKLKRKTKKT